MVAGPQLFQVCCWWRTPEIRAALGRVFEGAAAAILVAALAPGSASGALEVSVGSMNTAVADGSSRAAGGGVFVGGGIVGSIVAAG